MPVFYYIGHGSLQCIDNRPDVRIVPTGVSLITSVECGLESHLSKRRIESIIQTQQESNVERLLQRESSQSIYKDLSWSQLNPIQTLGPNIGRLKAFQQRKIQVQVSGMSQVNTLFAPGLFEDSLQSVVNPAGLQNVEDLKTKSLAEPIDGLKFVDLIAFMYGDSVQPGLDLAMQALEQSWNSITSRMPELFSKLFPEGLETRISEKNKPFFSSLLKSVVRRLEISFDVLFEKFAGVHLQDSCRGWPKDCSADFVEEYV